MVANNHMLDANAILRFLLQDIEEQFRQVKHVIRTEKCYVTLEVLAEVCFVLEGLYQVSRRDIVDNFRKLNFDVVITFDKKLKKRLEDI